jgi:peptidoglycan/LPS O-acetylase OafA/YrhL
MAADIRALTGVRGVAAVAIVIYHFGDVHLYDGGTLDYFGIPHGYLMVEMFFMLSGYVIGYNYRDSFNSGSLRYYATFMLKRVARLYPAFYAIGLLYIAKIALGFTNDTLAQFSGWDIVGNLLMVNGWGLHVNPLIGVSWASSAEMGSYLLLPILMGATLRRGPWVCGLAVVAACLAVYAIGLSGRGAAGRLDVVNGDTLYPLLRAVAGFTIGLALFRVAGRLDRLGPAAQDGLLVAVLAGIVAVCATASAMGPGDFVLYGLFAVLVAVLSRDGRLAQFLFGNALVYHLGLISYSIYLIHPLFVSFAVMAWRHFGQTQSVFIAATAVCCAAIWLLSYLSYRLVEMPGRRWVIATFGPRVETKAPVSKNAPA